MRRFPNWSLRSHLLFLVLMAVLPALLIVLAAGLARHRAALLAADASAARVARLVAKQREETAENIRQSLSILAETAEIRSRKAAASQQLLHTILKKNPGLLAILVLDPEGRILASSTPANAGPLADRKYFRDTLRTRRFSAGEFVLSRTTGLPVFHFAYPVLDEDDQVRLVLATSLRLANLDVTQELRGLPAGSSLSILDHRGTVLYASPGAARAPGALFPMDRLSLDSKPGESARTKDDQGLPILSATTRSYLPGGEAPYLITHVEIPESLALAGARRELAWSLGLLVLAAGSALVVAWILGSRVLISPIRGLISHVDRVSRGEFGHTTGFGGAGTELDHLAQAFDEMSSSLQKHHEALRASEAHYRLIFDSVSEAIFIHDLKTAAILDVNAKMLDMYGCTREEALCCSVDDLSEGEPPYSQAEAIAWIRRASGGAPQVFEWHARKRSGELFWAEVSIRTARIDGEERLLVSVRDIQARKTAEAASLERETLFRLLFERSGDANFLMDGNRIVACNQLAVDLLRGGDRDAILDRPLSDLSPAFQPDGATSREKADDMIALAFKNGSHRFEWIHQRLDGTSIPVEVMLTAVPWQGKQIIHAAWRDQTEQKRSEAQQRILEAQFLQAQKLESLGVLAGGIAHDFNNLLTAILGNLNLAQFNLSPESPAAPFLENAERTVLKASDLTKQMLAYSGKGRFVVKLHDMNEVVQEMTHLLKVSIAKKALLRLSLAKGLPAIEVDGAQFQQVIMNLVTNASDALGDQDGVIHIRTGEEDLDARHIASVFPADPMAPGRYVTLEVSDTGVGMSPEVLSRIFDPFFTTKPSGRGLGLSAMLGILRGHKAGLKVYSEAGRGTTFKAFFPAAPGQALGEEDVEVPDQQTFLGTVLLVDDEKAILQAVAAVLEQLGFTVITAEDGQRALETFQAERDHIDLVIMDLTMPRLDGRETFNAMRRLDPDVKVILSSGYNEQESIQQFLGKGLAGFIQKPYTLTSLRKTIHAILHAAG